MAEARLITPGEQITIWRRRENLSQRDISLLLGVPLADVPKFEQDQLSWDAAKFPVVMPYEQLLPIRPYETCFLMRKRANMQQKELAQLLGVSRYWLNIMERGKAECSQLIQFWIERNAAL